MAPSTLKTEQSLRDLSSTAARSISPPSAFSPSGRGSNPPSPLVDNKGDPGILRHLWSPPVSDRQIAGGCLDGDGC